MAKSEKTSPPAGTGNMPGLGEAYTINLSTGQGTYAYKLPLPDGVAGHTPQLALEYAHGVGHGPFGLGWRIGLRSITRRLDFGPPAEGMIERFLDSGTELMPIADGTYRAMRETGFGRYTRVGDGWRIEERNGSVHELGTAAAARVAPPDHPDRPVEWLVERTFDTSGNDIAYTYDFDQGVAYPAAIRYAAYEVRFLYEARPDVRHDGRAGFSRRRALRCQRIELVVDPGPGERIVRSYRLVYRLPAASAVSLLSEIRLTAHGPAADGSDDVVRPTVTFGYTEFDPDQREVRWMTGDASLPPPLLDEDAALVTLDDAPLPGMLLDRNGRRYYWAGRGDGRWAPPRPQRATPIAQSFRRDGLAFVDMDGSGTADLMVADPGRLQGYYQNGGREGFRNFVAFPRGARATPRWRDPNVRLTDVDGDGLIDAMASRKRGFLVWRNRGRQGWSSPSITPHGDPELASVDLSNPDVHLADVTGDGLPDLVRVRSGAVEYWPSLGRGRFGAKVVMADSPRLRRKIGRDTLLFADLDGDGCAELIHISAKAITIHPNQNGTGFGAPISIAPIPAPICGSVRAVSLHGRGAGLVWNSATRGRSGWAELELTASAPPLLLSTIDNGSGLQSEIRYRHAIEDYRRDRDAGVPWTTNFPFPYVVVGGTREVDTVSGRETIIDLAYHEAHFEARTRQFQGFRRTERIERGDESRPDTLLVHRFLMAEEEEPGHGPEYTELNGLLERIETYALDGTEDQDRPYRVETCEHGLTVLDTTADGRKRSFVFVTVHRREDRDRTDDVRIEEKRYSYDAVGNVIREELRGTGSRGGVAQPERVRITETSYASATSRYLVDKPARVVVRDGGGTLLSERRLYYDGPDFVGLPLGSADRGLIARDEEWALTQEEHDAHYAGMDQAALGYTSAANADGVASVFAPGRTQAHDARGLLVASRDPLGAESRFTYEASGLFRTRLVDTLGETLFEYDRATGQITSVTYADGGITRFAYDAQGRVLRSALPGETLATASTVYAYDETVVPNRRVANFRQPGGATSTAVTYFDGAGKEFQQRVEIEPGRFLVSGLKVPNRWGDLCEEYEPTFAADSDFASPSTADRPSRTIAYDACGRVVRTVDYTGGVSTAVYQPFRIVLRDANDNDASSENQARGQFDTPRVEELDVLRCLVAVTEHAGGAGDILTRYQVGPLDELTAVADGQGEKFRYRYDRRGNRLGINLRESGERKVWYDARKKPIRTLDPAGHELTATWDALGRQTELRHGAQVLEAYSYDDPAHQAFGRIARVNYVGGSQAFFYDRAGHVVRREYRYDGEATPRSLRYEYDPLGRQIAVVHDDDTRIERRLTFNGWLAAVPDVIDGIDYDPRGIPIEMRFHNGVRTTSAYTPGPGRLRHQRTVSPHGDVYQDVTFTYDAMGVMIGRDDGAPGGTGAQTFAYDPLYQITSVAGVEEGVPVERRYEYAPDYNLRRFDEGKATLHYDDAAHPDRLSALTPDGGARFEVDYDGNGNLLHLPGQSFTYNSKNELVRFTRGDGLVAQYRYDHVGLRISKTITGGPGPARTLYLGDQAEIRAGAPAYFVTVGPLRVAVIAGGAVRCLHGNGVNSTGFVTDETGARIGSVESHPFGNIASANGDLDYRTFLLHPVDAESGLVYMRRRYYAPSLGRFLTPDLMAIYQPEKFLHAPAALHLYAFVANDPMNRTDPTGLSFWSVLGAVVGVIVGIVVGVLIVAAVVATGGALGVLLGIGLALGASLLVTGISYAVAANVDPNSAFGQFMRGFMIGFNAGMNGVLAGAIFGPVVGVALGVINFLAAFDDVAKSPIYQGILGWSSWLMPMSWGATGLGVVFFVANLILAGVTGNQVDSLKIDKLGIDWQTGTIVMVGGAIRGPTAFDLGHFVFMNPAYVDGSTFDRTYDNVLAHETGHTLEAGAFGSAFLIADFIGENAVGAGMNDYGERIAESHVAGTGRPTVPMWG